MRIRSLLEFNALFIIENIPLFCTKTENATVSKNVNYAKLLTPWATTPKGCEGFWVSTASTARGVTWENSGEDKIVNIL